MILAAHVGVGISGNEGMQAVMASDFAIAQFRFLRPLLLLHGRYNYRRLCKLVLYSFYKNIAFVLCQFWFAFDSVFSANNLYDAYGMALYNLAFTTLPLLFMGWWDRDVPKHMVLRLPMLYEGGRLSYDFSLLHLLVRLLAGLTSSLILWFTVRTTFGDGVLRADGLVHGHWVLGTMVYHCVILVATCSIALDFRLWTWFHVAAIVVSLATWFIFTLVDASIHVIPDNMHGIAIPMYQTPAFWFLTLLLPVACLLPEVALQYIQWQYLPMNDQM